MTDRELGREGRRGRASAAEGPRLGYGWCC